MTGNWIEQTIGGKPADVFTPSGQQTPRLGVIFLHGYGLETLPERSAITALLEQHRLACVCPHGQHSWWTDRICPEFDAAVSAERYILESIVPFFAERWNIKPPGIGVFGISMGGQGALRLAFRHPQVFPVAAGISSALDFHELYNQGTLLDEMYDSKEQCRQDTAILHVPPHHPPPHLWFCIDPDDAPWLRGNDRLHEKLTALGIPHTADLDTRAGGHTWPYFDKMAEPALRFVVDGLTQESRRLL